MLPAPVSAQDSTTLATRLLESHFRAREAFTRALDPILSDRFELDMRDYMILRWIDQQDLTPSGLAQILHVPGYATSRLLDPFIKRDLVRRVVDQADARRFRLHLTPKGRAIVEAVNQEVTTRLGHLLTDLGPERAELLLESLDLLSRIESPSASPRDGRASPMSTGGGERGPSGPT
ncbi:MarR family winged helix-turn-helix transcriptional regulator [Deinococcus yavapaiensis]|uniref:DNA-binding MarR family transcriptional regulator n=1 Tax=Deinococcus yavapaiensis KR-236 TaxID=694435 RepID=A0A318RZ62_9DEIO|nr:MarR family winged helix-turn-helix transcriptional regulator [Deinococcus yavapaiensis]PYE48649.1 DNA-binding MarR family transcriptional regulator [Deinococcus yavapaiensis KR-236]